MSSFICAKCNRSNVDSPEGYIEGCEHYPPEKDAIYDCLVERVNASTMLTRVLYKDKEWQLNGGKVVKWAFTKV